MQQPHIKGPVGVHEAEACERGQEEISVGLLNLTERRDGAADCPVTEEEDAVIGTALPVMEVLLSPEVSPPCGEVTGILELHACPDILTLLFRIVGCYKCLYNLPASLRVDDMHSTVEVE